MVRERQRNNALLALFAKEAKSVLALLILLEKASAPDKANACPKVCLWLALKHSWKRVSKSAGAVACASQSPKDGLAYAGSVSPLHFDIVAQPIYSKLQNCSHVLNILQKHFITPH
jgi:hypothetical protein